MTVFDTPTATGNTTIFGNAVTIEMHLYTDDVQAFVNYH